MCCWLWLDVAQHARLSDSLVPRKIHTCTYMAIMEASSGSINQLSSIHTLAPPILPTCTARAAHNHHTSFIHEHVIVITVSEDDHV